MKFSNILHSGFTFNDDEHELRLKYILFNCLLYSNIFMVLIAGSLRLATGDLVQGIVDLAYVGLALIAALLARRSKLFFQPLILCMLAVAIVIVTLTYYFSSSDITGVSWFVLLMLVAFYLTEKKKAYSIFALSGLLVIYLSLSNEIKEYTVFDVIFGVLPLFVTLVYVQFYDRRNVLSRNRLRVLNAELETKVQHTTTELSISEDRFRNLVENLCDWVWEMDKMGVYSYASSSVFKVIGYGPKEVEGVSHRQFLAPDAMALGQEFFAQYIMKNKPFNGQVMKAQHKDGSAVMLEVSGQPIFSPQGIMFKRWRRLGHWREELPMILIIYWLQSLATPKLQHYISQKRARHETISTRLSVPGTEQPNSFVRFLPLAGKRNRKKSLSSLVGLLRRR